MVGIKELTTKRRLVTPQYTKVRARFKKMWPILWKVQVKILFVYSTQLPNIVGIQQLMHNLATSLIKRGHSVTVITSNAVHVKSAYVKKEEYIDGVRVKRVSIY